jgi:phospholipid/cholesterol/gamma-HCH transport system permease protein
MAAVNFEVNGSSARLVAVGGWTVADAAERDRELADVTAKAIPASVEIDVGQVGRIDTAGAFMLVRTARAFEAAGAKVSFANMTPAQEILFGAVASRNVAPPPKPAPTHPFVDALAETGRNSKRTARDAVDLVAFTGQIALAFLRVARNPARRLRLVSIVHQVHRAGLASLPIVILMSFLIGAIIAQQGAFQLRRFGAEVFVVNLVGILVLREVGLLLAAIIFAGRSGSAFTAEIGSMRMREEIDAMRVIGLDPIEVLVLPRLTALVISLPIVTVVSNLAALFGGLVTCWLYLNLPPAIYLEQLQGALTTTHLWVGLIKAPFMAMIIGIIAAIEGLAVEGSTESLGLHTTASVVKAIFMVIVVDGIFAMVFAAIGW